MKSMKELRVIVVTVLCFATSLAHAENTNTNNTSSSATAITAGNVSNNNPTANSLGVGSVKVGPSTSNAQVGNASASNGNMSTKFQQNFVNNSHVVTPGALPFVSGALPGAISAPIYGKIGKSIAVAGISSQRKFINACGGVIAMHGEMPSTTKAEGQSGDTEITFTRLLGFYSQRKYVERTEQIDPMDQGDTVQTRHAVRLKWVTTSALQQDQRYACIGVAQVKALKGHSPDYTELKADVAQYTLDDAGIRGFRSVMVVEAPSSMGGLVTMNTKGSGFNVLGEGASYALNGLTNGALGASLGHGNGSTTGSIGMGETYFIVARSKTGWRLPSKW